MIVGYCCYVKVSAVMTRVMPWFFLFGNAFAVLDCMFHEVVLFTIMLTTKVRYLWNDGDVGDVGV